MQIKRRKGEGENSHEENFIIRMKNMTLCLMMTGSLLKITFSFRLMNLIVSIEHRFVTIFNDDESCE